MTYDNDCDDRETWAEAHGFRHIRCPTCGWSGMTDGDCERCIPNCDKCDRERAEYDCVGDWCDDCASRCVSCGEAVLDVDLVDEWCERCDTKAERCPLCGGREDRGCEVDCTAGGDEEEASE